jgi:hypothetical protein
LEYRQFIETVFLSDHIDVVTKLNKLENTIHTVKRHDGVSVRFFEYGNGWFFKDSN